MTAAMRIVNARLGSVAQEVGQAGRIFNDFRRLIGKWRLLVVRHDASSDLAGHVAPIDQMLHDGHGQMAGLHALAVRCQQEIVPFDGAELDVYLGRIWQAAGQA